MQSLIITIFYGFNKGWIGFGIVYVITSNLLLKHWFDVFLYPEIVTIALTDRALNIYVVFKDFALLNIFKLTNSLNLIILEQKET